MSEHPRPPVILPTYPAPLRDGHHGPAAGGRSDPYTTGHTRPVKFHLPGGRRQPPLFIASLVPGKPAREASKDRGDRS